MNKTNGLNNKKNIWKDIGIVFVVVTIGISFMTIASAKNGYQFPEGTPLQNAIKQEISNGNFSVSDIEEIPEYSIDVLEKNESHIKLKSKTVIKFKNPKGAGYANNKWPKFEVKDDPELRKNGTIRPGNYDQAIKDYIASSIQNITSESERTEALSKWNTYDFESGPRTEIIEETYEITYSNESQSLSSESISNGVLMGFTRTPHINWIVEDRKTFLGFEIYYYKAGFELGAAYGLRLPTETNLNTPALMMDDQNYMLSTIINGADWNGAKYTNVNVPSENGNEFVASFSYWLGVNVRIVYYTVVDWHIEGNKDYGRSFKTPIGPSESFPNLDLNLDPTQTGLKMGWSIAYLGIGLGINPDLSPDKITADWASSGDSVGNGLLEYHAPGTTYNFGPIHTGDYSSETDYANVRLSNFKYYFDQCRFETNAYVRLHLGWTNFGRDWDFPMNLYTLNCGGSYLGTHLGTSADKVESSVIVKRDIISDSGFEDSPWLFHTDGVGTFSKDGPGFNGGHSGHIAISEQGNNVQLYQDGLRLKSHTSYRLNFKAYSNRGHDLSISVIKHLSPYTNYGLSQYFVNIDTAWKEYVINFVTSELEDMNDGRLMFWLAPYDEQGDHYYFDDITITKI